VIKESDQLQDFRPSVLAGLQKLKKLTPRMGAAPDTLLASADWQLVCTDGKILPCHSLLLCAVSKVFADLHASTAAPKAGEVVEVPFNQDSWLGED